MSIIGITSNKSVLVSFDPAMGIITAKHAWLDPTQTFVGLTYDYGRNMFYAVSQAPSLNLYSVNPLTRDVTLIGQLTINGDDVSGLAYDPLSGTLYTLILHLGTPLRTDLARVNPDNLQITVVGTWQMYWARVSVGETSMASSMRIRYRVAVHGTVHTKRA